MGHPNNAAYQARWRERQKAKIKQLETQSTDGFAYYVRASRPLLDGLKAEGGKNAATMVPATVAFLTALLERLNERWGSLSPETRSDLAKAQKPSDLSRLLPPLR
jgi:hypothetical protein